MWALTPRFRTGPSTPLPSLTQSTELKRVSSWGDAFFTGSLHSSECFLNHFLVLFFKTWPYSVTLKLLPILLYLLTAHVPTMDPAQLVGM